MATRTADSPPATASSTALRSRAVSSLAVVFFLEANCFCFAVTENFTNMDFSQISCTLTNDTGFSDFLFAENAIVSTNGDAPSRLWNDAGISWAGSPDLQDYVLTIDAEDLGYNGMGRVLTGGFGRSPRRIYPCSPKRGNVSLLRGVGWASFTLDAESTVNLTVYGSELSFVGYHDKDWGAHRLLWKTSAAGIEATLAWGLIPSSGSMPSIPTTTNKPLATSPTRNRFWLLCGNMKVRPTGDNATFPPMSDSFSPTDSISPSMCLNSAFWRRSSPQPCYLGEAQLWSLDRIAQWNG
ncbi:hypothetical protein N7532_006400 [Penicillium argentinense]|uniref:Uncharacterized protein n=1 Tax=Penicillium argentinense TaxID=1131581 RepID=A0A9W9FFW8_9EURO|nr:uncharacterized protein N7532_006400 [Penicillium argentinense]KAJ5099399.1 hypothetical protein N7532_006400 [Penicillium argentinense]